MASHTKKSHAPRALKKHQVLIQSALNRAIADGYEPFDPAAPNVPNSACIEAERRLGLPSNSVAPYIKSGQIVQNCSLYDEKDPHGTLFLALRQAGIEVTTDEKARLALRRAIDELQRTKSLLAAAEREQLTLEEIRTKVYGLPDLTPVVPDWVVTPRTNSKGPGTPITLWSDWHYGETVEPKAMSGKNAYNLDIADRRIEHLVDRIIDISLRHQVNPVYPGIIVCLAGDMFSGDGLHEELTDTNQAKTLALFMRLQGRLIWAIEKMADAFGRVYVPCDFGNHGRNTIEHRYKLRAETNYEFLLYNQLEFYFKSKTDYADRVSFSISQGEGVHFTVGKDARAGLPGHRYYLIHGDFMGVKGGDGIIGAIGPIKRGRIKVGDSEESIGQNFDTLLMGHWHQYIPIQGIIVNGTLKGWCDYARYALRAPFSPPTQALWFNHPLHGPVTHHKIVLEAGFKGAKRSDGYEVFPPPPGEKPQKGALLKLAS